MASGALYLSAARVAVLLVALGGAHAASVHADGVPASGEAPREGLAGRPAIAVASSLRAAWPALETTWRDALPGVDARPSFGASRTLARQIVRGAPFELLLAADEASLALLAGQAGANGEPVVYARGRLVLLLRERHDDAADTTPDALATLAARLTTEPALRVAVANPAHAPYGQAARETLEGAGLWPLPSARLALGENAAQTLQFLLAGAVDAAFVPAALVAGGAPPGTRVHPIDPARHAPLVHALVLVDGASDAARALAAWFVSPAAREALQAAGLDVPP